MDFEYLKLNKDTKLFPMVGYPMEQSSSGFVYNPILKFYDANEITFPVEIPKGNLPEFLQAFRTLGMRHFALTMPHKADIIPLLDEVEETSRIFNSVNIVKMENGKTIGAGMDGKGCLAAIREAGIEVKGMEIAILGAGSIVGAICYELAKAGVKKVTILNRTLANAEKVAGIVKKHTSLELCCLESTPENLNQAASACDLFMQSTPKGMLGYPDKHEYFGFLDYLKRDCIFMENIVNPPETELVKEAKKRGHKIVYGMDMTICQMGEIFHFCFGTYPPKEALEACRKSVCSHFGIPYSF